MRRAIKILVLVLIIIRPTFAQSPQWRNITPEAGPQPEARRYGTAIYDAATRRIVVFGGLGNSGFLNDVWAFDLSTKAWTPLNTSGSAPAPRFGHNAVYDEAGHQMIIWAGQQGGQFFNDTWSLDLQSLAWRNVSPTNRPKARYGSASIFDPSDRRLVQFAGFTEEAVRYQDTQAFNVGTSTWQDLTPSGILPQVRCLHTAAFDPGGRRMLMFGGQRSGALGDFWSFDLQSRAWTAINSPGGPAARFFSTSFVNRDGAFMIFGGTTSAGTVNDTWAYQFDSSRWIRLETETAPSPRSGMMGAYIESEDRFVIFGGSGATLLNDLWELSRATLVTDAASPSVKTAISIVNPGDQPASVSFFFTDSAGQDLGHGTTSIPPNGQLARFVHEAPFNGPTEFRGTLTLQSAFSVTISALQGSLNQQSEFVATSLPIVDLGAALRDSAILSLIADGGGWASQIVLVNPTDQTLTGSILLPAEGTSSPLQGGGLPYSIPPRSARTVQRIGGAEPTQLSWARVTPTGPQVAPHASVIVTSGLPAALGTRTAAASVSGTALRIYVENQ